MTNKATKFCSKCEENLLVEKFGRDSWRKDGLQNWCKKCKVQYVRDRLANDPAARERNLLSTRRWRKAHPERVKECRAKHPDKARAQWTIRQLVRSWKIPRAKDCKCKHCGKPAAHYHHYLGYAPEHWRSVIPLCAACHGRTHSKYHE